MNFDVAYQQWSIQKENRELYNHVKGVYSKATFMLTTNLPCRYYSLKVVGRAFAACKLSDEDKTKAASVIVHVLNYAHVCDPDENPKPDFDAYEIVHYHGETERQARKAMCQPDNDANKRVNESANEEQKKDACSDPMAKLSKTPVVQIDASTLKPVRQWPSCHSVTVELGIKNVQRAVERHGLAGGFFWCRPGNERNFQPRKGASTGRPRKSATTKQAVVRAEPANKHILLSDLNDEQLIEEMRRRGWKGHVTIVKTIDYNLG